MVRDRPVSYTHLDVYKRQYLDTVVMDMLNQVLIQALFHVDVVEIETLPATRENTNEYILEVYNLKKIPKLSKETAKYYLPVSYTHLMTTLSGLVSYIKAEVDSMKDKMIVHVVSPTEVQLISMLDGDRKRECLVKVNADIPAFTYGKFKMCIRDSLISARAAFCASFSSCFFC